ncbi:M20/M25/M40 family metallo-hydrolase [Anderseniella sp. Alg231-50]|uniref:M20/M25/M40 family metallo-hydrolase n=1 Tax=Anderseniella sp. Alg231-50 TaxID=1922226 RepID=UPI000D55FF2E
MAVATRAETEIAKWLADHEADMISLLEALVNTDSGSYYKQGVDAAGILIKEFLEARGIACDTIPIETHGDAVRATVSGTANGGNRPIVLMGHRDTVFPRGEPERRPFTIRDGRAYGPGVADMKAGLVMNAFVLAAFADLGGAPVPLVGLFTGDEEIGSPSSAPVIARETTNALAVFNSEPGRVSGNVVTGRKGGIFFRCTIKGKAAHSGANFADGVSAIGELAHKINAWHGFTDIDRGITVNVGLISGGQSVNTVAPVAACDIDTRFIRLADRDWLVEAITEIADRSFVSGTTATMEIMGEFKPLEQSPESADIFDLYTQAGRDSGLTIAGEFSGGCADSGIAASVGTPTICGVGPVGAHVHSPDEYMELSSFVPRAQTLARSILRMHTPG